MCRAYGAGRLCVVRTQPLWAGLSSGAPTALEALTSRGRKAIAAARASSFGVLGDGAGFA